MFHYLISTRGNHISIFKFLMLFDVIYLKYCKCVDATFAFGETLCSGAYFLILHVMSRQMYIVLFHLLSCIGTWNMWFDQAVKLAFLVVSLVVSRWFVQILHLLHVFNWLNACMSYCWVMNNATWTWLWWFKGLYILARLSGGFVSFKTCMDTFIL